MAEISELPKPSQPAFRTDGSPEKNGPAARGLFLGMDEAGYGPNLGPLLIAVTQWKTPAAPERCDFYKLLRKMVAADGHANGKKLHLADSKVVFTGKHGFQSLETSALALMHCLRWDTNSFQSVWTQLIRGVADGTEAFLTAPWYRADIRLPVAAEAGHVRKLSQRLLGCLEKADLELIDIRADVVVEHRFNQLVEAEGSNKSLVLSRLAFRLLRALWSPDADGPALIVGDKHGGRNRYDELLAEVLEDEMIFRLEEGQQVSRYRVRSTELRFQVGGEAHLPVACASIIAKYMRELSMDLFNAYWATHCPEVKPTRGYPNDARRFRDAVDSIRKQLEIEEHVFWRNR